MKAGKSETLVATDEQPPKAKPDKIPTLKPAFRDGGTVTAANSSSISDGAAALIMMRESEAEKRGAAPLARVVAHSTHAAAPKDFPTAPIGAVKKLFDKTGWSKDSVDLFEINEAFAVVAMAAMRDLGLPHEKVNVNGGACALGHPIGASGARILVTLIAALARAWAKARRRVALHRRRRGDGDGDRDGVNPPRAASGQIAESRLRAGDRPQDCKLLLGHVDGNVGEQWRAEIALAGIGKHAEDVRPFRRLGRDLQRAGEGSARGYADENAFFRRELLAVANGVGA